jgi:hypothetical protein
VIARELLRLAARAIPASVTGEAGLTVADARECLDHNEWEPALDILMGLGEAHPTDTSFWENLGEAAHQMRLDRSEAWCNWRLREVTHGVIRADLRLVPGARRTAIPGDGRLRPLWDIGQVNAAGRPDLAVAIIWVENAPDLRPGGYGSVRLAPLTPARWRHLTPGDRIVMHERRPVVGTATITDARFPEARFPKA